MANDPEKEFFGKLWKQKHFLNLYINIEVLVQTNPDEWTDTHTPIHQSDIVIFLAHCMQAQQ